MTLYDDLVSNDPEKVGAALGIINFMDEEQEAFQEKNKVEEKEEDELDKYVNDLEKEFDLF